MTALGFFFLFLVWILFSALILITLCMTSSRFHQLESLAKDGAPPRE